MNFSNILTLIGCLFATQATLAQSAEIKTLTENYYGIKNALVADDGKQTASSASDFLETLNAVPEEKLDKSGQKVWKEHAPTLKETAERMAETTDVAEQREQLNALSTALFAVIKTLETPEEEVFYQYCPMKKAYWLSDEKAIKNPYYGNKMLTCGSVKETLK